MPHLVEVQKKYQSKGFVVVASHCQSPDLKAKALALLRSKGCNFMVTSQGRPAGDQSRGIPQAYLFDWTGKCVAEGHPSKLYSKIDELMRRAPNWLTGGREFKDAKVADIAKKLNSGKDFGGLIEDLAKLEGEDASYLKERLVKHGQSLLAKAQENETENAYQAQYDYKKISKVFKGHEFGEKAKKRLKELKKDKNFQTELKAARYLAKLEAVSKQYKPQYKPEHPANRGPVANMRKLAKYIAKKYPDTTAARKAKEMLSGMGF